MAQPTVSQWTVDHVSSYLTEKGFAEAATEFQKHLITGNLLAQLTEDHLKDIGIREIGTRLQLMATFRDLASRGQAPVGENGACTSINMPGKVFNDPIHGHIQLHGLAVKIIDTPQFQRLRNLKQLGGAYRVYPGASHNRFEHSIGVCHLAGVLAETLRANQPELNITEADVLCVQVAGLCHDLGHGPFSHLFDGKFMVAVARSKGWKHEDGSIKMLDYLIEANNLKQTFTDNGLEEGDIIFIKELIYGPLKSLPPAGHHEWPYKGRGREKGFLYEIVSNKRTGIDVDRWDYFARDCHHLGIKNNFDHVRFMEFARVLFVDGDNYICTRDKEAVNVLGMFLTRYMLYHSAYCHVTATAVELMIAEALKEANDHLLFQDSKGDMLRLSDTVDDMEVFTKVADDVYYRILWSSDAKLEKARQMLIRIECRRLIALVGQTTPIRGNELKNANPDDVAAEIAKLQSGSTAFQPDDLIVQVVSLGFGSKDDYPLDHVYFYSKANPQKALRIPREQVSQIVLPQSSQEQFVRVYCKLEDSAVVNAATAAFSRWCAAHSLLDGGPALASLQVSPLRPAARRAHEDSPTEDSHPSPKHARKHLNI